MKRVVALISVCLVGFYSCEYNKYDDIKPKDVLVTPVPCDSSAAVISYSKHIAPLMEYQCGSKNTCHSNVGAGGNISLEDYNGVSYAAATGQLMSCIVWDGATEFMPENTSTKMDACYISEIQRWVNAGFPNN
jgi:hypothetical protein